MPVSYARYAAWAAAMVMLAWCALAASGAERPITTPAATLHVRVVDYDAPSVGKRLRYALLSPKSYERGTRRYPVLFLLHGHTGHYRSWLDYAGLPADSADRLDALIVLVDSGNGFQVNWSASKNGRPERWEDAVLRDLVPEVDRRWRTRPIRGARAIGGLSMGGYGAITLALRHPDTFGFAFSSAGALRFAARAREELIEGREDWNRPESWPTDERGPAPAPGFATQRERTPRGQVFATPEQADAHDPFVLAAAINPEAAPFLHLDCGTADSLCPETRAFAALLRERGIAHSMVELPGDHDPPFWLDAFAHTRLVLERWLSKRQADAPPPAPSHDPATTPAATTPSP